VGISQTTYYLWKRKYSGAGVSERRELRQLREENGRCSLRKAAVNITEQGVFGGPASDAEIRSIGFGEPWALQAFEHTSLVVINRWEIGDGGDIVHENLKRFAPSLHTPVKF
jgi:hypothetical protein